MRGEVVWGALACWILKLSPRGRDFEVVVFPPSLHD